MRTTTYLCSAFSNVSLLEIGEPIIKFCILCTNSIRINCFSSVFHPCEKYISINGIVHFQECRTKLNMQKKIKDIFNEQKYLLKYTFETDVCKKVTRKWTCNSVFVFIYSTLVLATLCKIRSWGTPAGYIRCFPISCLRDEIAQSSQIVIWYAACNESTRRNVVMEDSSDIFLRMEIL